MSVGCGGVASVIIAWLIDFQNSRNIKIENADRFEMILKQYVKLYQRLLWTTINECHGLYRDNQERNLEEWLSILSDESRYTSKTNPSMQRRCERLSANLYEMQKYIENFQVQSATLILNGFPETENLLSFFELQHVHIWSTLSLLEHEHYKAFCETTYILYKEFLDKFPQYQTKFPKQFTSSLLKEWKI